MNEQEGYPLHERREPGEPSQPGPGAGTGSGSPGHRPVTGAGDRTTGDAEPAGGEHEAAPGGTAGPAGVGATGEAGEPGGVAESSGVPRISDEAARNWAAVCHLTGLAWVLPVLFANIIVPLVVWLMKRESHPLIDRNGKEAVNFQISMTIYLVISGLLVFVFIGIVLVPAVLLADLVLAIIAAIKTQEGKEYRYPVTIRLVK